MSRIDFTHGGAHARTAYLLGNQTATAGGAGDNTAVPNTIWVDRAGAPAFPRLTSPIIGQAQHPRGMAQSAKIVIAYTTTLAITQSLSFSVQTRDATSAAGAAAANFGDLVPLTVVRTATAPGTFTGTVEIDIDLAGARAFMGATITPDLSAGATDTVAWSAHVILFGDTAMETTAIANVRAA